MKSEDWIRVEERLPEERESIRILLDDNCECDGWYDGGGDWFNVYNELIASDYTEEKVISWKPTTWGSL